MSFELSDILRRLENLIRFGTVAEIDGIYVRVDCDELKTQWLRTMGFRAGDDIEWDGLDIGEQVVIFSPSGDVEQGVVFPAIYSDQNVPYTTDNNKHGRQYKDGAIIEYDRNTHHLKAILPDGATTEITSTGGIVINGNIEHNGDLVRNGKSTQHGDNNINGNNTITGGDVTADDVSLKHHKTKGIKLGDSTGGNPV